ncbi:MAG: PorV/PorQ family protein, partial [Bacteroidota bacterium]
YIILEDFDRFQVDFERSFFNQSGTSGYLANGLKIYPLLVIFLGLQCLLNANIFGQANTPKYSNEFLNIGVGARSLGMGSTGVSFVDDVTAAYWNPAGLLRMQPTHQIAAMHSSYFGGLANYDYVGLATTLEDDGVLSLSAIRFSVDDIPDTRFLVDATGAINYDNIQFFSSADYSFLLSYARELPFLGGIQTGGNLKVIYRTVGEFSTAWGFGLDIGAQKKLGQWQFGAVLRDVFGTFNAWSHNVEEFEEIYALAGNDIPVNTLEVTLPRLIIGAARKFDIAQNFSLLTSLDMDVTSDGRRNTIIKSELFSIDPKAGAEFGYKNAAFIRFGASQMQQIKDFDGSTSWTVQPNAGVGFKIRELSIDYALTDIGDLAPGLFSHVFSLKVDFNAKD